MTKSKVVPLRITEELDEIASLKAEWEHTDKATALRQWLHESAAIYLVRQVGDGRLTMSRAAELLSTSIYELYNVAEEYRIEIGATAEQARRSRAHTDKLVEAMRQQRSRTRKTPA
jgi:hypothetical protein